MSDALRVVIVEDEAVLVMAMECFLEDAGHLVIGTAATSKEAFELVGIDAPDLVFVDLHLRDGDTGLDVAKYLVLNTIKVVLMTANDKKVPSDLLGAVGLIRKPYSRAGLVASIKYIGEHLRGLPADARPSEFILPA